VKSGFTLLWHRGRAREHMVAFQSARLRPAFLVLAAAVACLPVAGAELILTRYAADRARTTVEDIAGQVLRRADAAIEDGLEALTTLAMAGIAGCAPADIARLREASYAAYAVKEAGVIDATG